MSNDTMNVHLVLPEEAMAGVPEAAYLLRQASADPKVTGAILTAINASPADLRAATQNDLTIEKFRLDILGAVSNNDTAGNTQQTSEPGVDAIQASTQGAMSKQDNKVPACDHELYPELKREFEATLKPELLNHVNENDDRDDNIHQPFQSGTDVIQAIAQGAMSKKDSIVPALPVLPSSDHTLYPELIEVVKRELEATMKPELLNRIDEIVVFSPLSIADLTHIAFLNVKKIVARAGNEHDMTLEVTPDLMERIVVKGNANADQFGARPMRRATQQYIEDSLSDAIVQGFLSIGDSATLSLAPMQADNKDRVRISSQGKHMEVEVGEMSGIDAAIPRGAPEDSDLRAKA
jgi:C-terminal, D2-small domain, of ClpB protein